ncbi:hypothetical protein LTR84_008794 [Exophiala bonariae]|uniref:Uncharacterized protein n=1 Tax=Exophiala bonariae TaxID=1690606 RepID=A0AAV9MZD2_9EURO|nr:hypothetical protein LTR84_008794 [Exophiala bonariae]
MTKTAIVTGACSGIGLSLVRRLLHDFDSGEHQQWRVVLADINVDSYKAVKSTLPHLTRGEPRHLFVRTDVTNWNNLVDLFRTSFEWPGDGQGRIDFVACNAGIDDHALKNGLLDDDDGGGGEAVPTQPDLKVLQVDLHSIFYATKLLVHFTRKSRKMTSLHDDWKPRLVVTASMAAQYPFFLIPQYTAAKHGCLGLVRALAPALLKHEGISLNCVMPGTVDTGLIPPPVMAQWPTQHLTPLDTVMRAFMELIGDWERAELSRGVESDVPDRELKNGCAVECSSNWLWYRDPVPFKDESMRFVADQSREEGILGQFASTLRG